MPTRPLTLPLEFLWLELLERCNLACVHCYVAASPRTSAASLPTPRWMALLDEARELGCTSVQLTGGEATLHPDTLALMDHARTLGFTHVELFSNATRIDDDWALRMARAGHRAAVSLYSHRPDVHDRVTTVAGSHARTLAGIRRLIEAGVRVRVETVVLDINRSDVELTRRFIRDELGVLIEPKLDPVRPTGRGKVSAPVDLALALPRAPRLSMLGASGARAPNLTRPTCWAGKLAISPAGEVHPCIFARDLSLGNVTARPLSDLVQDARLKELWSLSLEDVPACRGCDRKSDCFDCRALAFAQSGDLRAKNPRCGYVPPAERAQHLSREGRHRRTPGLVIRELGEEAIVLDREAGAVHLLNPTSASLLERLAEPRSLADLVRLFRHDLEVDEPTAERDVRAILASFQALGLADRERAATASEQVPTETSPWERSQREAVDPARSTSLSFFDRHVHLTWDAESDAVADKLRRVFRRFEAPLARTPGGRATAVSLRRVANDPEAPGRALLRVSELALEAAPGQWAIHAAACVWHGRTLLFPAGSGQGKSTLALNLVCHGAKLLSDEIAWLVGSSFEVEPFPRALMLAGFDEGAHGPALRSLGARISPGLEGTSMIVELPEHGIATERAPEPAAILFPAFEPEAGPRLLPLSRARAAAGLVELTLAAPDRDPSRSLDLAVELATRVPAFALRYASWEQAEALLRRLYVPSM